MQTVTSAEPSETPSSKRTRRWLIVLAALILVVLGTGAAVVFRYRPLGRGASSQTPLQAQLLPRDPSSDTIDTHRVPYSDGEAVQYGFTITNYGRLAVTVVGLAPGSSGDRSLLRTVGSQMEDDAIGFLPLKPFALAPGKDRYIVVSARLTNCEYFAPNTTDTIESVFIRYRILGISKTMEILLPFHLRVDSPPEGACPRSRKT